MSKEKRKHQSPQYTRQVVYVLIALAIIVSIFVIGLVLGGRITDSPSSTLQLEVTAVTETLMVTSDSDTVDLPALQTQWAELEITRTVVNSARATPTPE